VTEGRARELAGNLDRVRSRIAAACAAVGRPATDITLVAVTKTWPAADVRHLADLGVIDVGENRDQEASRKHAECSDLGLRWHFVGRLQRNKVRSVAGYADVVHGVDRLSLIGALSAAAVANDRPLTALVQIALTPAEPGRGGVPVELAPELAAAIDLAPGLTLGGVMAIAPLDTDPDAAFAELAGCARVVQAEHPAATVISAGMSGDLEAAVRHGATHVRIGTALLGHRAPPVG
jgi:pyridoxal phosphate enzyme (YggS family)